MATRLLANASGSLATGLGGGNLVALVDSDPCECCELLPCFECSDCDPCDEEDEPGCLGICSDVEGCCTPCNVEVVFSGVDAGLCGNCIGLLPNKTFRTVGVAVDGTHCLAQDSVDPCKWTKTLPNAATIRGWDNNSCSNPTCEPDVSGDLLIEVRRTFVFPNKVWTVLVSTPANIVVCNVASGWTAFDGGNTISTECKSPTAAISNIRTCGVGTTLSDTGTAVITPCCSPPP